MTEVTKRGRGRPRKTDVVETETVAELAPVRSPSREKRRDSLRQRLLSKKRHTKNTDNAFHINPDLIPDGISLEWKRWSLLGQTNTSLTGAMYISKMQQQGWETMTAEEFPEILPEGANPSDPIEVEGLLLMARPAELTNAAHAELKTESDARIRDRMRAIGSGSDGHAPLSGRIETEIGIPVPKD